MHLNITTTGYWIQISTNCKEAIAQTQQNIALQTVLKHICQSNLHFELEEQ